MKTSSRYLYSRRKTPSRFVWLRYVWAWIFPTTLMIFLMIGGIKLTELLRDPKKFPFRHLHVLGNYTHIEKSKLTHLLSSVTKQGFFSIKMKDLKDSLLTLAWIKEVSFQRLWPDTLVITIEEQQPIAYFGDNQLMSKEGALFAPSLSTFPSGLPKLYGPPNSQMEVFAEYQQIQQMLAPLNLTVTALSMDARHAWSLILNGKITVVLGRRAIEDRLIRLIALYPRVIANRVDQLEHIDLRYSNGVAIKWRTLPGSDLNKKTTTL